MRKMYYKLVDGIPVECTLMEWAAWMQTGSKRILLEKIDDVEVSTVFLGLNHAYEDGPPLVFETMVFGGTHDGFTDRYSTLDDAKAGHASAVRMVKFKINLI